MASKGTEDAPPAYDALGNQGYANSSQQPPYGAQQQYPMYGNPQYANPPNAQGMSYQPPPMGQAYQQPPPGQYGGYQQAPYQAQGGMPMQYNVPGMMPGMPQGDGTFPPVPPGARPVIISVSQGWEALFGGRASAAARRGLPPPGRPLEITDTPWVFFLIGGIFCFLGILYTALGLGVQIVAFYIIGPIFILSSLILLTFGLNKSRLRIDPTTRTLTTSVDCCPCCCPSKTLPLEGLVIDSEYMPGVAINHQPAVRLSVLDPISGTEFSVGGCRCCECCSCTGCMEASKAAKIKNQIAGFLVNNGIPVAKDARIL